MKTKFRYVVAGSALSLLLPWFACDALIGLQPGQESYCDWINEPENCFRQFHQDALAVADPDSPDNPTGDCRTYDPAGPVQNIPTQATEVSPGVSNGTFATRTILDTCSLYQGGQVTFSPPIDLSKYLPSASTAPPPYTIHLVNPDNNECGAISYVGPQSFSITINPPPDAGSTAVFDAGVSNEAPLTDAGVFDDPDGSAPVATGRYTQSFTTDSDAVDVTCPSGEAHHFNLAEVLGPAGANGNPTSQCGAFVNLVPSATLAVFAGGIDFPGAISLAITWPPDPTSVAPYVPQDDFADAAVVINSPTVYFNCAIPAIPEMCSDGVKDGSETDIDCGGPQGPTQGTCGTCPVRCEADQQCLCDADCDTVGSDLYCIIMSGIRQCQHPEDGGVNETVHFPHCSWEDSDAGSPKCFPTSSGTGAGGAGGAGTGGSPGAGGSPSDAGIADAGPG